MADKDDYEVRNWRQLQRDRIDRDSAKEKHKAKGTKMVCGTCAMQANPPATQSRTQAIRPMRGLLHKLPALPVNLAHEIDFPAADPKLLVFIADDAETLMRAMHNGSAAIGQLLAHASPMVEDGTIDADCIESVGYLLSEMGDLGAGLMVLAAACRKETADYTPPAAPR